MNEHEILNGICTKCGSQHPGEHEICVKKETNRLDIRPEPMIRNYAVYDIDVINDRILELKKQKDEAINYKEEE